MRRFDEWLTFFRQFRKNFQSTGAILPSSRFLASAITRFPSTPAGPARYLEAGPGTGAFTGTLLERLRDADRLVLCELNPQFVAILRARFETDPAWSAHRHQVEIVEGPVESLLPGERFHAIVCGLPFANFDPGLVAEILERFWNHLHPGGHYAFFEYLALRRLKALFVPAAERRRLRAVGAAIAAALHGHVREDTLVFRNVPPAVVHRIQKPA